MSPSSGFEGRWLGRSRENEYESFIELVVSPPADGETGGKWRLCIKDRHYPSALEAEMSFVSESEFEASVPHWLLGDSCKTQLLGHFRDGKLYLRTGGNDMTGIREIGAAAEMVQDPRLWDAFLRPLSVDAKPSAPPFEKLVARVLEGYSATLDKPLEPRIDALMVVQDGTTLFEEYFWGISRTDLHMTSSCTKSVTAILVGIAIDQGLFSLEDEVVSFFPWISDTTWGQSPPVLVRHVLSMTSGTADSLSRTGALLLGTDAEEFVLGAERECPPGTRYQYDNGLPWLMGCIVERTSGLSLEDFANKYLFGPLDIRKYEWSRARASTSKGKHPPHAFDVKHIAVPQISTLLVL
jgi:hypothetical protein